MDMLSVQTPSQPTQGKHWPDARALRGQTYGVNDPIYTGDRLVVMTNDTWLDYGTAFEQLRRQCGELKTAAEKLKVAYDIAIKELADLRERHENLRRAEKRRRKAAMGFTGSNS